MSLNREYVYTDFWCCTALYLWQWNMKIYWLILLVSVIAKKICAHFLFSTLIYLNEVEYQYRLQLLWETVQDYVLTQECSCA